jgi:hypothetical protein
MSRQQWDALMAQEARAQPASDEQTLAALLTTFQGDVPVCRLLADGALIFAWRVEADWLLALRHAPVSLPQPQPAVPPPHAAGSPEMRLRAALQRRWRRSAALDQAHLALGSDGEVVALCRFAVTAAQHALAHPGTVHDAMSAVLIPLRKLLDES